MPLIKVGESPHRLLVVGINREVGSVKGSELSGYLPVIFGFAQRIVHCKFYSVLQTLANRQHEAVVQRVQRAMTGENRAGRIQAVRTGIERHREGATTRIGEGLGRGGHAQVRVREYRQMQSAAEDVRTRNTDIARQLLIDGQFPFVHQRIHPARILTARGGCVRR